MTLQRFLELAEREVSDVNRQAAEAALDLGVAVLGLPGQRIRWFQEAAISVPADRIAFAREITGPMMSTVDGRTTDGEPGVIWIRAGRATRGIVESVLHECWHQAAREGASAGRPRADRDVEEAAALAYGRSMPDLVEQLVEAFGP